MKWPTRGIVTLSSLLCIGLGSAVHSEASHTAPATSVASAWGTRCTKLSNDDFSTIDGAPTQVIEAALVTEHGAMPQSCEVRGYVVPNVGFRLQLPSPGWNGKFFETGCGGSCGSTDITYNEGCNDALRRGYACIASDMGHQGSVADGLWAYNNLQAQIDFGYRGAHVAALAGKAITKRYYGDSAQHSFFWGCSTGGRQALIEAQRFPWDFDGIIAGAPWIDDTDSTMDTVWAVRALRGKDGNSILTRSDLQLLHKAVLDQCDMDDGIRDGIIGYPLACHFDPSVLVCKGSNHAKCLTPAQAAAAQKVYAGPTNSKGEKTFFKGPMPGSELQWDWIAQIPATPYAPSTGSKSIVETWALEYFRYMILPPQGAGWTVADFDFDQDYKRLGGTSESLLNASNPDLRKFQAAGGKLLMYQGWSDPLGAIPEKTVDYYEVAERVAGGETAMKRFARLFMVPGMGHCGGGEGASELDFLTYLENWVERDNAPDKMIGAHLKGSTAFSGVGFPLDTTKISFTRPVYPYPRRAVYRGTGDPNSAANFQPLIEPTEKLAQK